MGVASLAVKVGDTLEGRYKVIRSVGEGGMGTVYLAEHMLIKRRVAIKILRPELAADSAVVERFMNEARAAGAIGHPHIVESTDMGFTRDEVPFIVFEYLEGTLLTDEIYRVRGMPPRRALRIAAQIASALHAAHTAGIIHRDLKSDNVFLTDKEDASDHVKVLDFGISRFMEAEGRSGNFETSQTRHLVMGTPEFMAPEQILTPAKVDKRADIYALGVVLYEMLTAKRPFDFDETSRTDEHRLIDTDKLLHKIVTEPVPSTSRFDLPPGLEELMREKLLAKDPDHRYQSMKDVQAALEAFFGVARRDSEPIPVASPPLPEAAAPAAQVSKPKRGIAWLIAALLVGGAGAALLAVEPKPSAATIANHETANKALEEAATKIASILDTQTQAARMRADGIASLPMLRNAIETDAATLKDMVKDRDVLFKAQPDEVLEIFQVRESKPSHMLRIPETAHALTPLGEGETRLENDGNGLRIVVGAPVVNQKGITEGVVALAQPVDLATIKQQIAKHTPAAVLLGIPTPIVLAGTAAPTTTRSYPITTSAQTKITGLSLAAAIDTPEVAAAKATSPTFAYARFACWGLAGLMLVMFGVSRARKP
jgi:serine/threonine-protein kinase